MDRAIFLKLSAVYAGCPTHGEDFSRSLAHLVYTVSTITLRIDAKQEAP